MSSRFLGSAVAVVALCAPASASVIVTNSQALWNLRVTNGGQVVGTETFNDFADGFYSGMITDTLGNVTWTASATGGLFVDTGWLSTDQAQPLVFNFNPGVRAVAGNIFGTDINSNVVSCVVSVTLANGVSYEGISTSPSDFVGFYIYRRRHLDHDDRDQPARDGQRLRHDRQPLPRRTGSWRGGADRAGGSCDPPSSRLTRNTGSVAEIFRRMARGLPRAVPFLA